MHCVQQTLAERRNLGCFYRVALCSCGHLHLSIGPVTVRLQPEALRDLDWLIDSAVATMDETSCPGATAAGTRDRDSLN